MNVTSPAHVYPAGTRFREVKVNRPWYWWLLPWKKEYRSWNMAQPLFPGDPGYEEAPFEVTYVWQKSEDAYKEIRKP